MPQINHPLLVVANEIAGAEAASLLVKARVNFEIVFVKPETGEADLELHTKEATFEGLGGIKNYLSRLSYK